MEQKQLEQILNLMAESSVPSEKFRKLETLIGALAENSVITWLYWSYFKRPSHEKVKWYAKNQCFYTRYVLLKKKHWATSIYQ